MKTIQELEKEIAELRGKVDALSRFDPVTVADTDGDSIMVGASWGEVVLTSANSDETVMLIYPPDSARKIATVLMSAAEYVEESRARPEQTPKTQAEYVEKSR